MNDVPLIRELLDPTLTEGEARAVITARLDHVRREAEADVAVLLARLAARRELRRKARLDTSVPFVAQLGR